jgi:transcriptional regulator NrdR family protein
MAILELIQKNIHKRDALEFIQDIALQVAKQFLTHDYVEGILVNFFGRLYEKGEKELSDDKIKDIIKDNLKKIENNVIETLISYRQLKNRSYFIPQEHTV